METNETYNIAIDKENYIDIKNKIGLITGREVKISTINKEQYLIIEFDGNNVHKKTFDMMISLISQLKLGYTFLSINSDLSEISFTFIK